jgi:hypothetical protein
MKKIIIIVIIIFAGTSSAALGQRAVAASAVPTLGAWLERDNALAQNANADPQGTKLQALHREIVNALVAAQAGDDANQAVGRPSTSCRQTSGPSQLTAEEIGKWLRARPRADHGLPLTELMKTFLRERLKCQ